MTTGFSSLLLSCSAIIACSLNTSRIARASPAAALLISCFSAACSFVIVRRSPFSLMTIFSLRIRRASRAALSEPFGRPLGLIPP